MSLRSVEVVAPGILVQGFPAEVEGEEEHLGPDVAAVGAGLDDLLEGGQEAREVVREGGIRLDLGVDLGLHVLVGAGHVVDRRHDDADGQAGGAGIGGRGIGLARLGSGGTELGAHGTPRWLTLAVCRMACCGAARLATCSLWPFPSG